MPSKTKDSSYRNLNSNAAPQLKEPLLSNTSESHDHGHSHAHSHGHQHEHKHDHNHSHGHGHSHVHGHSHHHIVEMTQKQPCNPCPKHAKLLKEQQQQKSESDTIKVPIHSQLGNSQGHDHGHSHGHSHDHDHDHKHNDQDSDSDSHDHSHSHSHSHDHDHDHNHSDDDHHHDRDSTTSNPLASKSHSEITKLKRAMFFAFFFMLVEIFGGLYANSIAIITDAAHMLSDVGGLFVSLFALQLSAGVTSLNNKKKKEKKSIIKHGEEHTVKKRSDSKLATFFLDYTFGYGQAEVVGAFLSILLVWLLTGGLIIEAVQRLQQPEEIDGKLMFWIASLGLVVNLILLKVLGHDHGDGGDGHSHGHSHGHFHSHGHGHAHGSNSGSGGSGGESNNSLALDAALLHVIGDIVQSVGVMLAAGLIWWQPIDIGHSDTGMRKKEYTTVNDGKDTVITEIPVMVSNWNYADPLCTFLFAILVLFTTKGTVKGILSQVMMRTPSYIDCKTLLIDLEEYDPRVICVHDLHVWSVGSTPCLTCHCVIGPNSKREDAGEVLRNLTKKVVLEKYGIEHSTIQIEVKGDYDHIVEEKYGGLGCGHNLGTKGVGCCK